MNQIILHADSYKSTGYLLFPYGNEIKNGYQEDDELDPENPFRIKESDFFDRDITANEKDFIDDLTGSDLDVPGSELDDQQEKIGSEDEEINYYSIGGDKHKNLDEDNGGE